MSESNTTDIQEINPLDGSLLDDSSIEEVNPVTYCCEKCGKQYKLKNSLYRHLLSHQPNRICCTPCHQYFSTQEKLNEHVSIKHKSVMCEICGKIFKLNSSLNLHRKMHQGIYRRTYTCPWDHCRKKFYKPCVYEDHLHIHTGHKPYSCSVCDSKFGNRYEKNAHERLCSGQTEIKCGECGIIFTHRSSLYNHVKANHKHNVFTCHCGSTFVNQSDLCHHRALKHDTD